jgi:alanine racemase
MSDRDDHALRTEARIDLPAIRDNVSVLAERAGAGRAGVMAVVKADGYGHGLVPSARAALAGGAGWLGVATIDEALALRAAGIDQPVLAWLNAPSDRWADAIGAGVDVSANATWAIEEIAAAADRAVPPSPGNDPLRSPRSAAPARVHLKVDTGLGRGGAARHDWPELVDAALKAEASGQLKVVGLWSHLAYADEPGHPTIARQVAAFREAVALAENRGVRPEVRHLANSAATLTLPEAHFDLVRPGIAVYGITPVPQQGPPSAFGLRPAMTLAARVILTKRVSAGHGVSYGHQYTTATETTLALVPLGYADGVPRAATNTGPVLLGGKRRRIAGRVCMDQFVVDVGDDAVAAGEEAILFGPGDAGEPTAEDWARTLDTIAYEIVTRIGPRVPRVYLGTI